MSEAIELPRILLLDEADASLHPSMVKSLLTVVQEIFVKQYDVRVILTTHSPSTVALAPEESLYIMNRSNPRLEKATTDEALKHLTVGLPALSVKLENRRQVFVESTYDQAVYQELYRILKPSLPSDRSLEFIGVGKGDNGGNSNMVISFVNDLRKAGNDTIFGIVDRDNRQDSPDFVHYMPDRYAIENLVLDPLLLGAFLLRAGYVKPEDFGLDPGLRHFELRQEDCSAIIAGLASKMSLAGTVEKCTYNGGFDLPVPGDFLSKQGHDLESLAVQTYPQLNAHGKNLKREIINKAAADVPAFIPVAVVTLFEELLAD